MTDPRFASADRLLGTISDAEVSRRTGLSADEVGKRRRALGIRALRRTVPADALRLLGQLPDPVLSLLYGGTRNRWRGHRTKRGIASFAELFQRLLETRFFDEILSTSPSELAERYELQIETVRYLLWTNADREDKARNRFTYISEADVTGPAGGSVRSTQDQARARALGVAASTVAHARSSRARRRMPKERTDYFDQHPEALPLLGSAPDTEVAERLDLAQITVGNARRRRGIRAYHPWLTPELEALLGQIPHAELAEMAGVEPEQVRMAWKVRKPVPIDEDHIKSFGHLLGLLPDAVLHELTSLTRRRISSYRRQLDRPDWQANLADWRARGLAKLLRSGATAEVIREAIGVPPETARYLQWQAAEARVRRAERAARNAALAPQALIQRFPDLQRRVREEPLSRLSRKLGVSQQRLRAVRALQPAPKKASVLERHPELAERLRSGESVHELAREYAVSAGYLYILRRRLGGST